MRRRTILAAAATSAALPVAAGAAAASVREPFFGVWRLARYELKNKASGTVTHPYTEKPAGIITYDSAGRMSAQLMKPGRRRLAGQVPQAGAAVIFEQATADELREAAGGYIAYWGTFDVDETKKTVVHHVQGCLLPNWVGTDLRRQYQFPNRRTLILTADTPAWTGTLVWERD